MKQRKRRARLFLVIGLALLVLYASPLTLPAQEAGRTIGQQTLGRPYWHVFTAYAVAWLLVLGWLVSMARRLRRVEERLEKE